MGLRYNPKLSICKLKIVHHWDVSTKSMLVQEDGFSLIVGFRFWLNPVHDPFMSSSRYRKPDETVNLQHSKTGEFQQRLTVFLKLPKGLKKGVFGCFAENHFRPHRVDQVFSNSGNWDQFTSQTLLE